MKFVKMGCLGVIGLFVLVALIGALGGGGDKSSSTSSSTKVEQKAEQPKQYTEVDVDVLNEELKNNAAAAQKKYKGQNLKITGKLGTIDSDGKYISIKGTQGYDFKGVHCTINKKDKAQEDFVLALQKNQMVTAYGTVTDVGEIMGYKLKVDKFE